MITFNDFIQKHKLKKATSNLEINRVLSSLDLNDFWIYLRDGLFKFDIGIVDLQPSKGTHWVCYIKGNYFDSYGVVCPKKLSKFIIKRNDYCLYFEYQIQKNDSFYGSYGLYVNYFTKVVGIDFISAVLNLYYQRFFLLNDIKKKNC